MEINGFSKGKESRLYKTALSKYEASIERARDPRTPAPNDEKSAVLNQEGKVIKGEIIDLRFQEAKIRLEPDGQVVTAKIEGKVSLFIGQTAEFVITDKTDDRITLRLVSSESSPMNDIVYKALYSAGITISERNKAIVRELLNFQMPVDKETILQLIRLTATYPDADIKNLILLLKNQLPVNPVNIAQLETYQQGMHQILGDLKNLTDYIKAFLENTAMVSISLDTYRDENTVYAEITGDGTYKYNTDKSENLKEGIKEYLHTQDSDNLPLNSVEKNGKSGDIMHPNAKMGFAGAVDLYKELLYILRDGETADSAITPETPIKFILPDNELEKLNEAVRYALNLYDKDNNTGNNNYLGDGRNSINWNINLDNAVDHAGNLPESGSGTLKDYVNLLFDLYDKGAVEKLSGQYILPYRLFEAVIEISDTLSDAGKEKLIRILKAADFHKQTAKALYNRWTINPDSLKEDLLDKKFYRRLYEDLERLKELADNRFFDLSDIKTSIRKLQDNLQFMRDLNDLFLYLQLPMRLARQDTHGDLYVFTRKHKACNEKEQLNVLLHLDMANLGPVDIHMTMKNRQINAVFYLEKTSEQLISVYLHELVDTLQNKGFQFQAKTKVSDSKPDFITDILQKDHTAKNISTYSFDIRA